MRRSLFAYLLLALWTLGRAQTPGLKGEFQLGLASRDIWRGSLLNDGTTFLPAVDLGFGTGTHATVRGSLGMDGNGTDEWRYGLRQDLDLVAATLSIGVTRFDRESLFADTTEISASAKMKWLIPFTFMVARDIDKVDGTYFRVGLGSGVPKISLFSVSASLSWDMWLGYADGDFAAFYYGSSDAGLADAGGRVVATFGVQQATVSVWALVTTLVDPDFNTFTGDRTNFAVGATVGWKF